MCENLRIRVEDLIEGIDFNWIERDGHRFREFTSQWLLQRGFCCNSNCTNCPYEKKD